MRVKFRCCDDRMNLSILSCVEFRFYGNESNVADGIAPVLVSFNNIRVSSPFNILERGSDDSIQYLSVDKDSFNSLKSMVKDPSSEPNKKRLMLATAQILLKNGYFVNKCKMPTTIYVYDSDEHYRYVREFSSESLEYLKYLPKTAKIEENYTVDAQTAGRLDKMANILYHISLNKAILYLFAYFNAFAMSKDNMFGSLYKALCDRRETAKYKPAKTFLDNIRLLSNEYSKARIAITVKEKTRPCITGNHVLKCMEFFLFLSQNFGYQIPQNLKTGFTNKINSLINTIKSVLLSYSRLKSRESLEDRLIEIKASRMPYNITIDDIADDICSTPVGDDSEYFPYMLSAEFLPGLIANMATIIVYKDKNSDFTNGHKRLVYNLLDRLQPLTQNKANFELFADYAGKDNCFPLCEIEREENKDYYYQLYGYYEISPENSLCYLNLAELFNKVVDSPYPYEFTKQALMAKLPEIMPVISTVFCDIPKILC